MKRVYVQTWGCQMNEHDSSRMLELLRREGYTRADDPREADLVLLNTCSVREKAVQKVRSAVGTFRGIKRRNPSVLIGVTGCVAQQEGEALLQGGAVDLVVGPDNLARIGDVVREARERGRAVATEWVPKREEYPWVDADPEPGALSAYVTIMKGCDNVCSFCIVPHVRGRERCRTPDDVVREVARHVALGTREVMLLGQNVNSYTSEDAVTGARVDFPELLRRVDRVAGLERLRFTTSHPKDFTPALADALAELGTVCEYLHLPVQSGNDRVLDRMRRGYTRAEYLERIALVRSRVPGIALSSDIIVGFPGETDAEFEDTMSLLREVELDGLFPFEYSPRPHTAAIRYGDDVPRPVVRARFDRMLAMQKDITFRKNRALVGETVEILVEGPSRAALKGAAVGARQLEGRTRTNRVVNFVPPEGVAADELRGALVRVRVIGAFFNSLRGEVLRGEVERIRERCATSRVAAPLPGGMREPPAGERGRRALPVLPYLG
jgi:tRNA-2-methylthio-N6-dimethylallyladenosine synthase